MSMSTLRSVGIAEVRPFVKAPKDPAISLAAPAHAWLTDIEILRFAQDDATRHFFAPAFTGVGSFFA